MSSIFQKYDHIDEIRTLRDLEVEKMRLHIQTELVKEKLETNAGIAKEKLRPANLIRSGVNQFLPQGNGATKDNRAFQGDMDDNTDITEYTQYAMIGFKAAKAIYRILF